MFNKFCLIFTLILLSYSNLAYSNPKNAIGEDQKTVNILNNYFSRQTLIGKANFNFLFWNMYDAKLISESGSYPSNKFALILRYNKDFSKKSVLDETINQLKKQKTFNEKELKEVNALLNKAFREIKKNNKFIGIKNDDEAIFYFQNEKVLETDDSEFIKFFFDIWLRENSQNPKFTQELMEKPKKLNICCHCNC